ncbi:Early endosome antigen 1 [Orchesella cincta]|uniref:Early endosome antigen 1 n=1 Tax=Orchesella cincta TaxID=48709 RepID=A0A1D2NKZ5_ORCCI|nr:Early endosome antigen 1 [Orchesella cincta]
MFNIKNFVNRITDPRNERDGTETAASFVETEEQHSAEGFLCPPCMKAFPSAEALEEHYNKTHAFDDGATGDSNSQPSNAEVQLLRQEIQSLQETLAVSFIFSYFYATLSVAFKLKLNKPFLYCQDERAVSDELKKEMLKMQADLDATELDSKSFKSHEKEFEDSKTLLTSEVTLLRQQLADSLEQISLLRKEKEAISRNSDVSSSDNEALKLEIVSLQAQLSHRNSIDDAEVLRQELVSVQRMMNELALEKEREIETLTNRLNELQSTAPDCNLEERLNQALNELQVIKNSQTAQEKEREQLANQHEAEILNKSNKITQLQQQSQSNENKVEMLQQECNELQSECNRLREQHAELCSKIETGEGAKAALEGLQKENEVLKQNSDAAQSQNRELSKQQHALNVQLEKSMSEHKLAQDSLDAKAKELKALKDSTDSLIATKTEELAKLQKQNGELSTSVQAKESEVSKLRKELQGVQDQFGTLKAEKTKLLETEKTNQKTISEQQVSIQSLTKQHTESLKQIEVLQSSVANLEKNVASKNEEISKTNKDLDFTQSVVKELQDSLLSSQAESNETKEHLEKQVAGLEHQLNEQSAALQEKCKESDQFKQAMEEELTNVRNKNDTLEADLLQKATEVENLNSSIIEVTEESVQKNQTIKLLQSKIDDLIQNKLELEQTCASNEEEKSQLLEKLISYENECKTYTTVIEETTRKRDDAMAALQELGRENQSLQIEIAKIQGRKWADDSNVSNCSTCTKEFTLIIRKHHCRHCGQIFCNDCSSKSASVPSSKKPVRVCDGCFVKLTSQ